MVLTRGEYKKSDNFTLQIGEEEKFQSGIIRLDLGKAIPLPFSLLGPSISLSLRSRSL